MDSAARSCHCSDHLFVTGDYFSISTSFSFLEPLPPLKPKLERKSLLHFNTFVDSYCAHFPGADRSVMMRTQRARFQKDKKRPAQIGCYFQVSPSFLLATVMILMHHRTCGTSNNILVPIGCLILSSVVNTIVTFIIKEVDILICKSFP